jgi:hypothetical protein
MRMHEVFRSLVTSVSNLLVGYFYQFRTDIGGNFMKLIRDRRLAQGWSQQELGNRVGWTKQHISD